MTLLTFVFNSNANIFDNTFINFFVTVNVNKLIKIFLYRFLVGRLKNQRRRLLNRCYFFLALWIFQFDMQLLLTILPVRYFFKVFGYVINFFFFFFFLYFVFFHFKYVCFIAEIYVLNAYFFTYKLLLFGQVFYSLWHVFHVFLTLKIYTS